MSRYIDADLIKFYGCVGAKYCGHWGKNDGYCKVCQYANCDAEQIRSILTAEVKPIVYGEWIRFKEFENGYWHIKCSRCGQYWSIADHNKTFKYCFNCGARMGKESEEEIG